MKATLIFVVLALVFTSHALDAYCDFEDASFVGGISLSEPTGSGVLTFSFNFVDPSGLLAATANAIHVHQFGFLEGEGCGSVSTGGHYNPLLNYGELSGLFGKFDNDTTTDFTFESEEISLFGEFGILGRSLVIHHGETAARIGCCNIVVSNTTDAAPSDGLTSMTSGVGMCGDSITLSEESGFLTVTNNDPINLDVYFLVDFAACDQLAVFSLASFPSFTLNATSSTSVPTALAALTGNVGLAGFSCVTQPTGSSGLSNMTCNPIILKTAQTNVNDVYEETDMTGMTENTEMTEMTEMTENTDGDMTDEMTGDMTDDMTDMTDMTGMSSDMSGDDDDSSAVALFISAVFAIATLL